MILSGLLLAVDLLSSFSSDSYPATAATREAAAAISGSNRMFQRVIDTCYARIQIPTPT